MLLDLPHTISTPPPPYLSLSLPSSLYLVLSLSLLFLLFLHLSDYFFFFFCSSSFPPSPLSFSFSLSFSLYSPLYIYLLSLSLTGCCFRTPRETCNGRARGLCCPAGSWSRRSAQGLVLLCACRRTTDHQEERNGVKKAHFFLTTQIATKKENKNQITGQERNEKKSV